MTMETRQLLRKLDHATFRPFRLKLADERMFDVVNPRMMIVGEHCAVVAIRDVCDRKGSPRTTDWRTIAINEIAEVSDLKTTNDV